ncbi:MAG: TatD family hydrolase [Myxococcales bacterium]|nr:TatD family hydrolase [Myxococcales bacterium]
MTVPLIDSHCHLDFADFAPEREAIIARGREAGVVCFVTIGAGRSPDEAAAAVDLAHAHEDVVATVGVHPHDAALSTEAAEAKLEALGADPRVVAIGEIGLDFHYDHSPRAVQAEVFRRYLAMARRLKKPVVIHTRSAAAETLAVLRDEGARDVGGIIHCFSEDTAFARAALDLDFDISFSGIVTFKTATAIREAARVVPLDRMLVETDSPYLAPIPFRGKRNEPAYVAHTARFLASHLGVSEAHFAAATTATATRRLGLSGLVAGLPGAV